MTPQRRALGGWLAVVAVMALGLVVLPGSGRAQVEDATEADLDRGGELYAVYCATCHGTDGAGVTGTGARAGPAIDETDVAYNDLLIRTGRMPLVEPRAGILDDPGFTESDRASLVGWMAATFDLPGRIPSLTGEGDVARGAELYTVHCAACHGSSGVGGISGGGATVRTVRDVDPVAIVEATRVGPFAMPAFSQDVVTDEEASDIAAFITTMSQDERSPLGLREPHRATLAVLTIPLFLAVLLATFFASNAGKRGS